MRAESMQPEALVHLDQTLRLLREGGIQYR